ncbi:hypothetical protein ODJ79_00875 [Actinoplanes sp. KI2]|uniref:glycine-rich domain-containing protein n=1 Tax=Actinoplanes sp. KI2 TaxID=2983315 RepID=UPI0021D5FE7E|nr:hypothetical protein [Actinoplanes sp. KI2]MCU7722260.1 hypothetical protein [Actinoplanes sp. KI2]
MAAPTTPIGLNDHRTLLPATLTDRLVDRITSEHPELASGMPARILDQTVAFLGTCATSTEQLGPSPLVDIGWHAFILYTREYAEFCHRIAGRFIHHVPDDSPTGDEWPTTPTSGPVTLAATVSAIGQAGYRVDPQLWSMAAASDCSQCHAGCHDSPTR